MIICFLNKENRPPRFQAIFEAVFRVICAIERKFTSHSALKLLMTRTGTITMPFPVPRPESAAFMGKLQYKYDAPLKLDENPLEHLLRKKSSKEGAPYDFVTASTSQSARALQTITRNDSSRLLIILTIKDSNPRSQPLCQAIFRTMRAHWNKIDGHTRSCSANH